MRFVVWCTYFFLLKTRNAFHQTHLRLITTDPTGLKLRKMSHNIYWEHCCFGECMFIMGECEVALGLASNRLLKWPS